MKKSIKKIDREFRQHWKNYVMQSILATTFSVFIVLYFLSVECQDIVDRNLCQDIVDKVL
ncbi:hypothetical protein ER57_06470 [Smithella sp. SCADC]|jgi:hypothetical protein|nr:hypothetical protein ER57_06470 [Smithella sp. SCADC]